jgi:hypothetical protein
MDVLSVLAVGTSARINLVTFACGSRAQVSHSLTSLPAGVIGEVFVEDEMEEVGSGRGLRVTAYNSDKPG